MRDFTLLKYKSFLDTIRLNEINIFNVHDWITKKPENGIFIRHDVDRNAGNALKISKLEYELDISATYYVRMTSNTFNRDIIEKISEMGHEVGYHYEDLAAVSGDLGKAQIRFSDNLKKFRQICKIKTIVAHGRPLSPVRNSDLIQSINLVDYNLIGDASLSIDYSDIYYFSDTGRTWGPTSANVRDKEDGLPSEGISSTDSLNKFLVKNRNSKIAIVMHPERWPSTSYGFLKSFSFDLASNFVKRNINFFGGAFGWKK